LKKNKNLHFIAYSVSSFISQTTVSFFYYPFDMIKTRIQSGQYEYKNFLEGIRKNFDKNEIINSIRKIYSGFLPSIMLNSSSVTLIFFIFELCRDYYAQKYNIKSSDVSGLDYFKCSFIAGAISAVSLNFLEVFTIQKIIHGDGYSFKTFVKPQHFLKAATSGLLARSVIGIFYTVVWLKILKVFSKIYNVTL
jgi:hypothetical protein